jgi:hypothetical protein
MLLAVLAASLLAGCAGERSGLGEDRPRAAATAAASEDLALPLDPYQPSPAHLDLLARARRILLVRCMRRFGVDPPAPAPAGPLPPSGNAQRYGLADEHDARTQGYHLPGMRQASARPLPRLSPAQEAALTGSGTGRSPSRPIPAGGCAGEAERTLDASAPSAKDPNLGQLLGLQSFARSQEDRRVRALFGAWSVCMRRAGFSYGDPMQANDDPAFRTERPSRAEIAVSVADVGCKQEVDLVEVWASVEAAYQERALRRHASELEVVRRLLDTRQRNAARTVADTAR